MFRSTERLPEKSLLVRLVEGLRRLALVLYIPVEVEL